MLKPLFGFAWFGLPVYAAVFLIAYFTAKKNFKKSLGQQWVAWHQRTMLLVQRFMFLSLFAGFAFSTVVCWFCYPAFLGVPLLERIKYCGFNIYFGLIGFCGAFALLLRLKRMGISHWLNKSASPVLLFLLFERVGCMLAGYEYGRALPEGSLISTFPVLALEAVALLVLYIIFNTNPQQINRHSSEDVV